MQKPQVTIVGAGLGGLVLARILQIRGRACTVYESDVAAGARRQGGSLDMHEESGQFALRTAALYEEFRMLTHPQGEAMRVLDKHGTVFIDETPSNGDAGRREGGRPEIGREDLRGLLIGALDPGTIEWGHKVIAAKSLGDGRHELTFEAGNSTAVDLLVGADGTWSKVRPVVSGAKPEYCGISYIEVRISDAAERQPDSAALVGTGLFFALAGDKALMGHGGKHVELGASFRVPQVWTMKIGVNWSDATAVREMLLKEFAGWSNELNNLIRNCDDSIVPRLIYALPIGHSWRHVRGVTLLGDAAHVMSPYAGEGANLAMLDATELASAIGDHGDDIEASLTRYETAMFLRSKIAAEKSAQGLEMCFAADAPQGLIHFFKSMRPPEGD